MGAVAPSGLAMCVVADKGFSAVGDAAGAVGDTVGVVTVGSAGAFGFFPNLPFFTTGKSWELSDRPIVSKDAMRRGSIDWVFSDLLLLIAVTAFCVSV